MRFGRHARLALGATLVLATAAVIGCGRQNAFTEEMQQQETEMLNESNEWKGQLAQWDAEHQEMHAWHSAHPMPTSGSPEAEALKQHEEKMAKHEAEVAEFKGQLDEHLARVQEEIAKPENDRVAAHAALWTEHMASKAKYGLLAQAHDSVAKEHAEFVSKSTPGSAPTPGS